MKTTNKKLKQIPKFKTEDQERQFWATHSPLDYVSTKRAIINPDFPNLKYSNKTISIRLPESLLNKIKAAANNHDVPYQSYIKIILAEKMEAKKI